MQTRRKNKENTMVLIRIDRDMLVEELYTLRGLIPIEEDAARLKLDQMVTMVANAPIDEQKAQFPRSRASRN